MRLFGTDGIRDIANQGALTPLMLVRIGAAFGDLLVEKATDTPVKVLMGEDGRASGLMIRHALSAGLLGRGVQVVHGGLMTTPALALITAVRGFSAGVMISASHNPAHHNGIKFFGHDGFKVPDELEAAIEERVARTREVEVDDETPTTPGTASRDYPILDTYRRFVTADLVPDLFLGSFKLVLDCANGGASIIAPKVLQELGADVSVVHNQPDGTNINHKCGSLHPNLIATAVKGEEANLGICLDGDGDRCILIDEKGNAVDGDRILMVLARHMHARKELKGNRLVCTVMSNMGLRRAMQDLEVETEITPVGDRSVIKAMLETGAVLGGEQSGHIILDQMGRFIGDGLVAALKVLEVMKDCDQPLSVLAGDFRSYPQVRIDLEVQEKTPFEEMPAVVAAVASAEEKLGDEGRVLLRYSGTEKLVRIMVEGPEEARVKELAKSIEDAIRKTIG